MDASSRIHQSFMRPRLDAIAGDEDQALALGEVETAAFFAFRVQIDRPKFGGVDF
jgi:hypothetical protein